MARMPATNQDLTKAQIAVLILLLIQQDSKTTPMQIVNRLGISYYQYRRCFNELSAILPLTFNRSRRQYVTETTLRLKVAI